MKLGDRNCNGGMRPVAGVRPERGQGDGVVPSSLTVDTEGTGGWEGRLKLLLMAVERAKLVVPLPLRSVVGSLASPVCPVVGHVVLPMLCSVVGPAVCPVPTPVPVFGQEVLPIVSPCPRLAPWFSL